MQFRSMEDRLNPIPAEGVDETTLGGYAAVHGRAPAFEAADGLAYTVAIETEAAEGASGSWAAYLVFLRWAAGGTVILGHLETDDLATGASEDDARRALEALHLDRVKAILEAEIARKQLSEEAP